MNAESIASDRKQIYFAVSFKLHELISPIQISLDEIDERSEVQRFMAHVPNIPTQADIEGALVERKKRELLQTFLGD